MNLKLKSGQKRRRKWGFSLEEVLISMSIASLTIGGTITGYIQVTYQISWAATSNAAQAAALERMEQVSAAKWDTQGLNPIDEVLTSNFPVQDRTLDMPQSSSVCVKARVQTFIQEYGTVPPVKVVRVECVWADPDGKEFTNSVATLRSPDQ